MCGRYYLISPADLLASRFAIGVAIPTLTPRYNLAPGQEAPVIVDGGKGRRLLPMTWGFGADLRLINARSESVAERPSFAEAFRRRRALVPADGFYEWRKTPGGRLPVAFRLRSRAPFAFAGLWEKETFAILTTDSNEKVAGVHDRMPVILTPGNEEAWLDPRVNAKDRRRLLAPYPAAEMEGFDVSTSVNSVGNEGPECLRPRSDRQAELFELKG